LVVHLKVAVVSVVTAGGTDVSFTWGRAEAAGGSSSPAQVAPRAARMQGVRRIGIRL
jgi:hypothetical protein